MLGLLQSKLHRSGFALCRGLYLELFSMGSFPVWLVHFMAFSLAFFCLAIVVSVFVLSSISYGSFHSERFLLGLFHTLLPSSSSCGFSSF